MKNRKKIIGTINDFPQFPKILSEIEIALLQGNEDYILVLDGTNYSDSISLLDVIVPDVLLLNLKLAGEEAIELNDSYMEKSKEMRLGMITSDPGIYYVSLCSTLGTHYYVTNPVDVELIAAGISKQQLN
jgi:DNA-binding NarL/FixJ family response regulator